MAIAIRLAMPTMRGEEEARPHFEDVFQAHFRFVCVTLRRLGVREHDVEDIAQDLFIAVHRKLPAYDRSRPFLPWLYGFCLRATSAYRRLAHNRRLVHAEIDAPDPAVATDDRIAAAQNRRLLLTALDALEDGRREVFVMHDLDEIPAAEIANLLTIPLNTVYSRLRHAREDLRKAVARIRAARGPR